MKNKNYITVFMLLLALLAGACSEDDLNEKSVFDDDVEMAKTVLDDWIYLNYMVPYNLDFKYRMEDVESSLSNNLVPIKFELAIQMARIVKHMWFEGYDEVGGVEFTRRYAPKVIHLIGSRQWNPNGTITLGYAEGGLKVTLVGGNWLNPRDVDDLNKMFFQTMHHEFAHILHQTKDYPVEYNELSEGHYSPSGWNNRREMKDYAPFGFVTAYGSSQPGEDIAEVTACYLTWTDAQWTELQEGAGAEGWDIIQQKVQLMKDYMRTNYAIDMDRLRKVIERRGDELQRMDINALP